MNRANGKFITVCSGLYKITTNIAVQDVADIYELVVLIDGLETTKSTRHVTTNNTVVTLNINQIFNFAKDIVVQLRVRSLKGNPVNVLDCSTWSAAYVGASLDNEPEFAAFLTEDTQIPAVTTVFTQV